MEGGNNKKGFFKPISTAQDVSRCIHGRYLLLHTRFSGEAMAPGEVGVLPVTVFASLLGIATNLHWDRFNHSHISFYVWALLYFTTPFLVFVVWLRNRLTDPGSADPGEVIIPPMIRLFIGVIGVITLAVGLLLFFQPLLMIRIWPWFLTPLTARVVGAMFALPGVVGSGIALEPRWSAARIILEAQWLSIAMILLATARAWNNFDQSNLLTWFFVGGLSFLFVAIAVLYVNAPEGRLIVTSSIAFPIKAYNARRRPQVSIFFSDPTGAPLTDPPAVLVQGDATVTELVDDPPWSYSMFKESILRQPRTRSFVSNPIARSLFTFQFQRLAIFVQPRRILVWSRGDTSQIPTEMEVSYVE